MQAELQDACRKAAEHTVEWIAARLNSPEGLGHDLAAHYKAPYLLQLAGRPREARQLLDRIAARFQQPSGDFLSRPALRTADPVLAGYPAYMSGWIAMAAHKIGRFDLSLPAWSFLQRFWSDAPAGFTLQPRGDGQEAVLELLTCAHLGLASLYFADLERARGTARALQRFLDMQPAPTSRLYLQMSAEEQLLTEFPPEVAPLHCVEAGEPGQAWFFLGYPIAFLCRLHQATGEAAPLATARGYGGFAAACAPRMVPEPFAHKVAWGCAELASATGEAAPRALSEAIVRHLLQGQNAEGTWLADASPLTRIDQSVEIAIWLLEVSALG
ncbi:conserved hypothetical protein [Cyanobium sp. PCC 7001]|uniref:hypothetical protein n=1 Tax=Cyanobium sp. PCC 7001 TaxID=180281 RepID=UPI000180499D|nr:hypothetical protein [Cyanobium sp. PCC 7001]EDY39424.1 conserved hypothetical protein [Cyanobium sp. PCC 7001]